MGAGTAEIERCRDLKGSSDANHVAAAHGKLGCPSVRDAERIQNSEARLEVGAGAPNRVDASVVADEISMPSGRWARSDHADGLQQPP